MSYKNAADQLSFALALSMDSSMRFHDVNRRHATCPDDCTATESPVRARDLLSKDVRREHWPRHGPGVTACPACWSRSSSRRDAVDGNDVRKAGPGTRCEASSQPHAARNRAKGDAI